MALLNTAATSTATVPNANAQERDGNGIGRPGAANQRANDGEEQHEAARGDPRLLRPGRIGDRAEDRRQEREREPGARRWR